MTAPLRVVQINVGSLFEPFWDQRRFEIVAWLNRLQPDVVCMQEVCESDARPNSAAWIAQEAAGEWHMAFGGDALRWTRKTEAGLRFGSAVLSRYPITHDAWIRLPVDADADAAASSITWELLHVQTADLDVFSTHLAAAPTHSKHRRKQVVAIDEYVRSVRGDRDKAPSHLTGPRQAMPAVLCGDFNAEPDSDEIRFLTSLASLDDRSTFWQDAWRVAGDGPGYTQDWRTNPIAADLGVHRKRIDYVFVGDAFLRADAAGRVLAAQLAFDTSITGVLASDHFGVVADIVWPTRPPTA